MWNTILLIALNTCCYVFSYQCLPLPVGWIGTFGTAFHSGQLGWLAGWLAGWLRAVRSDTT
jgi:hypothetical protein